MSTHICPVLRRMLNTSHIHFWQLASWGSFRTVTLEVCILIVQAAQAYAAVREAGGACWLLLVTGSVLLEQCCLPKCDLRKRTECRKQNLLWSDCSWSTRGWCGSFCHTAGCRPRAQQQQSLCHRWSKASYLEIKWTGLVPGTMC